MSRRQAAGGIALLVLATFLAIEALGPYREMIQATYRAADNLIIPVFLFIIALVMGAAGIALLYNASTSKATQEDALAATVEDPHHRPPIRFPFHPVTGGHVGLAPINRGVNVSEHEEIPQDHE